MSSLEEIFQQTGFKGSVITAARRELSFASLKSEEKEGLLFTIGTVQDTIADVSPKLARDWKKHENFFLAAAGVLKGVAGGEKSYSSVRADDLAADLRARPIIPQDFGVNSFSVSCTAGTAAYLWGGATTTFNPSSTANQRCVLAIIKNGIVTLDEKPMGRQFKFESTENVYLPWAAPSTTFQSIEDEKLVYQVYTPGAILLDPYVGSKLQVMPEVTGTKKFELFGMAFFEKDYYATTKWV